MGGGEQSTEVKDALSRLFTCSHAYQKRRALSVMHAEGRTQAFVEAFCLGIDEMRPRDQAKAYRDYVAASSKRDVREGDDRSAYLAYLREQRRSFLHTQSIRSE